MPVWCLIVALAASKASLNARWPNVYTSSKHSPITIANDATRSGVFTKMLDVKNNGFSMAVAVAIQQQIPSVAVGLHREDGDAYIENTPAFMNFLSQGIDLIGSECDLYIPFHSWTKAEVLRKGAQLHAPLETTWSCITPVEGQQDGTCSSCRDRRASFEVAGIPDPTLYAGTG